MSHLHLVDQAARAAAKKEPQHSKLALACLGLMLVPGSFVLGLALAGVLLAALPFALVIGVTRLITGKGQVKS